jgi:hypothetical protein
MEGLKEVIWYLLNKVFMYKSATQAKTIKDTIDWLKKTIILLILYCYKSRT